MTRLSTCSDDRRPKTCTNPGIADATNSKIYTPPIEVAPSTEDWSAPRKLQVAAQYLGLRGDDATILRYEVS